MQLRLHSAVYLMLFAHTIAAMGTLRAREVDYLRDIKPILKARCYSCHGALKQESGLRLDTGALIRAGSENGVVINKDDPRASELLIRISSNDDSIRMPPIGHPLTSKEQQSIIAWIAAGATSPENESAEEDPRDHWAFSAPIRPKLPATSNTNWAYTPIDHFVLAKAEATGLQMSNDATPAHLLRRVYLDLSGLPPSPDQIRAFTADPSQEHYRKLVRQLLDSDAYAERWTRHWMDIWRYSDWYGRRNINDVRNSAPQIWRWRDWIIDSLRADKGYDQMLREMLAADELHPDDDSTWPATGYLIRSYYSLNLNEWMRHNVEYTAKAFMGLTVNCAHCHDHKYDPIAHDDYFRLRAFFEPMGVRQDQVSGEDYPGEFPPYTYGGSRPVTRQGMVRVFDEFPDKTTWFYTDGDERNKVKERGTIPPGVPEFLDVPFPEIATVSLPMYGWNPSSRPHIQEEHVKRAQSAVETATTALEGLKTDDDLVAELQQNVETAEEKFQQSLDKAISDGETGPIDGKQSLLLDATGGRIILHHSFPGFSELVDGAELSFDLSILKDSHFNFQLARNTETHLTALYLGFVGGKISGYQPGTFTQFSLGGYDVTQNERHFHVVLTIHPESDTAKVHITDTRSDKVLVDDVAIALNGWNAAKHEHQPITFDTRTGSKILLDNVAFNSADYTFRSGFEPPVFTDGGSPFGVQDWHPSKTANVAPAFARVTRLGEADSASPSYDELTAARNRLANHDLPTRAATLRLAAATANLQAVRAVIKADNAIRDEIEEDVVAGLTSSAIELQATSAIAAAEADHAEAELAHMRATELDADDEGRDAAIQKATAAVTAASKALSTAKSQASTKQTMYRPLSPATAKTSTGRRAALAKWITDERHPLTPRVAVNHIWGRHFHQPLVSSVTDFGRNGKRPSHPELLDWLAVEFIESGWSMKHIHELIVTSHVYQQSSSESGSNKNGQIDPDNKWLWRMNQGRMEAEVIRDSILSTGGSLDSTVGGQVLLNTTINETTRRSLYYEVYPEAGGNSEMAGLFDPPNPTECYRRTVSVVPQQALAMSNSTVIHDNSIAIQSRFKELPDSEFVNEAFLLVINRLPTDAEQQLSQQYLDSKKDSVDLAMRRQGFIRVLFNHNDFVTIR